MGSKFLMQNFLFTKQPSKFSNEKYVLNFLPLLAITILISNHQAEGAKLKTKRSAKQKLGLENILTFNGTVRIPVSGNVPLAKEVRLIIETPTFQRLR